MALNTDLIRSGLPWSSPLKIIVQAAQVINDATINRGLLNLLNNDYYLDIKTQAINNYIENTIAAHIADETIHFKKEDFEKIIGGGNFLENDAIVSIPVINIIKDEDNIEEIQEAVQIDKINQLINKLPKYLNGHILIIQFVYITPEEKLNQNSYIPNILISADYLPVLFTGFSNGTIIIRSNISKIIYRKYINLITEITDLISYKNFNDNFSNALIDLQSTEQVDKKLLSGFTFVRNWR